MALELDLSGRRALVVGGGGGGIGTAVCEQVARAGADVATISFESEHVEATVAAVEDLGRSATGHVADVRDVAALTAAIEDAGARLGLLDLVVNVVGGATVPNWHRLLDYTMESFDHQIDTNLRYGCTILRYYLDKENGDLRRALGRYNGSLGKRKYPNKVVDKLSNKWFKA